MACNFPHLCQFIPVQVCISFCYRMEQPKRKITAAEKKRKSRAKQANKMSDEQKLLFKQQERKRLRKVTQNVKSKQKS